MSSETRQFILDAVNTLARPTTIILGGLGVFWGCLFHGGAEVYAIAAGMTGYTAYTHGDTKVKMAKVAAGQDDYGKKNDPS